MRGTGDPDDKTMPHESASDAVTEAAGTVRFEPRDDEAPHTVAQTQRRPNDFATEAAGTVAMHPDSATRFDLQAGGPAPRVDSVRDSPSSLRIGHGVVADAIAAPPRTPRAARPFWGRVTRVLSSLVTLVLLVAAAWTAWQWWQASQHKVTVTHVVVAPAHLLNNQCNVQYDIVGTIITNGKAGTISYEWLRSDGQSSGTLEQSVASGETSTTVHLYWKFTGKGSMTATATLHVLSPSQVQGATQFPYACK